MMAGSRFIVITEVITRVLLDILIFRQTTCSGDGVNVKFYSTGT